MAHCHSSWSRKHPCHFWGLGNVYSWGMLQNFLEKPYEGSHSIWVNNKYMSKRTGSSLSSTDVYHPRFLGCFFQRKSADFVKVLQVGIIPLWWEKKLALQLRVASATWHFEPCWMWCVYFRWTRRHMIFKQTTKNQPGNQLLQDCPDFSFQKQPTKLGWPIMRKWKPWISKAKMVGPILMPAEKS